MELEGDMIFRMADLERKTLQREGLALAYSRRYQEVGNLAESIRENSSPQGEEVMEEEEMTPQMMRKGTGVMIVMSPKKMEIPIQILSLLQLDL